MLKEPFRRATRPGAVSSVRAAMLAVLLVATPALAEHEVDHRYDIRGYVLNAERRPLDGVPVTILKEGQVIGSGRTDADGHYSIRVHLHDSDIGEALVVRADRQQATIRMQAERGNQATARVHDVNFVGSEVSEKSLSGGRIPTWLYLATAPFALWAAVVLGGAVRRKLRKLGAAGDSDKHGGQKKRKTKA